MSTNQEVIITRGIPADGPGKGGGGSMDHCDVVCASEIKDLILGDDALFNIQYLCDALSGHLLSQLLGGTAVNPQLMATTANCSST